jgi:hypothetical protein
MNPSVTADHNLPTRRLIVPLLSLSCSTGGGAERGYRKTFLVTASPPACRRTK